MERKDLSLAGGVVSGGIIRGVPGARAVEVARGVLPTGGAASAAAVELGPLVRRTWGDSVEIFTSRSLGLAGSATLYTVAWVAAILLFDLLDWRYAAYGFFPVTLLLSIGWRRWRQRSWFERVPLLSEPGAAAPGTLVRIAGTVEPCGQRFNAIGSRRPVVWSRTLFWEAGYRGRPSSTAREEVRGVPFRIRLDGGGSVQLHAKDVTLLEEARQLRGVPGEVLDALGAARRGGFGRKQPRFEQAALAPGDRVEALGHFSTEVNVRGEGAPSRGSPLVHTLAPPQGGTVWIRRAPPR